MDHCNFAHTMVARIFWAECLLRFSALWQRYSYFAGYCRHSRYFESIRDYVNLHYVEDRMGSLFGCSSINIDNQQLTECCINKSLLIV